MNLYTCVSVMGRVGHQEVRCFSVTVTCVKDSMAYLITLTQNMKPTLLMLTLFTFSTMACTLCQYVPYVSFMGTNLSNHSYVDFNRIGESDYGHDSIQCHTDLTTCCNALAGANRGDFYFPNGTRLPFAFTFTDSGQIIRNGVYESRYRLGVDLRRRTNHPTSGIYHCDIETIAVHTGARETVYVGVYSSGGEYRKWQGNTEVKGMLYACRRCVNT